MRLLTALLLDTINLLFLHHDPWLLGNGEWVASTSSLHFDALYTYYK